MPPLRAHTASAGRLKGCSCRFQVPVKEKEAASQPASHVILLQVRKAKTAWCWALRAAAMTLGWQWCAHQMAPSWARP